MTSPGRGPVPATATIDWTEARDALADQVGRVTALLRSVGHPEAPALDHWSLAEVAMHLSQAWVLVPSLAADDLSHVHRLLPHLEGKAGASLIKDMWDLGEVTMTGVDTDPERDPAVLADRIESRAAAFLETLGPESISRSHAWMVEGVSVGLPTLICHLLNETIVHGYDMARADGRRWPIPAAHAALVLDGFLVPVVSALGPRTMVDQAAAKGLRATFDIHVRGGGRYLFDFDDGALVIGPPGSKKPDCHISADPATFLLVAWARRSQWPAIARGQLLAWGRKPWLGPRFRTLIRSP
ncbi:MAG TPA: SCP2 sterol-binding domain-containing protein [Acidimicrobiales bacterium]|nr:SCP2 sterol-binding domain-containing protein [Acidimicrobiales bacterium]